MGFVGERTSLKSQPESEITLDHGGGDTRPLNDHVMTTRQVEVLLSQVLSEELKQELRLSGRVEFEYDSPMGPVGVTGLRRAGKLSVYLSTARLLSVLEEQHSPAEASETAPSQRVEEPGLEQEAFDLFQESSSVDEELVVGNNTPGLDVPSEPVGLGQESSFLGGTDDDLDDAEAWEKRLSGVAPSIDRGGLAEVSSFVDPSARPVAADNELGKSASVSEQRPIIQKAPEERAAIDRYLRVMLDEDCSDLHLTSNNAPLYRKDGEIALLQDMQPLNPTQVEELLLPIMPDRNYDEFLEIRDTDFAYEISGVGRFRCNVFMDRLGPGAVFRIIPDEILTAEDLKLSQDLLDLCYLKKGMVLVTGPTGSGKSTTLAALIDYINRKRRAHIITLEDPIEFVHPNKKCLINQREIGVHTMSFKNAIRAALREDPDIVLVGELRDLETIHMAIETAETGHLVFGTLHTNTAPSTVDRLIDQFPADRQSQIRTMLAGSMRAVISQTLCKKIGGGRVAALEVLMGTRAVSNLIREGKTFQIPSVMETKKSEGMIALNDSLFELVSAGKITPEEAFHNAVEKVSLRRKLESKGYTIDL